MKSVIAALLLLLAGNPSCRPCEYSDAGMGLTQHFEGYSPFAYDDVADKKTIGFGHLLKPGEHFDEPLLPDQATELLRQDVAAAERGVNRAVRVTLRQGQFDALTDFAFNLGVGALRSRNATGLTMADMVNAGQGEQVTKRILLWNRARINGVLQPVRGLTRRREAEVEFYVVD
jgi:lysozyme